MGGQLIGWTFSQSAAQKALIRAEHGRIACGLIRTAATQVKVRRIQISTPPLLYVAGRRMLDFPGGHFKCLQYLTDPYLVAIAATSQLPTE